MDTCNMVNYMALKKCLMEVVLTFFLTFFFTLFTFNFRDWGVELPIFQKYQFIFMSHVLINQYRPKTSTGEVEMNLIEI